jgi:acyl-CoA oxidase
MVIANLIDGDGVRRGVHNFLVPLRCMQTHQLLPGVTTGDIGPKIGYNVMDNGYARFDHVEIPRRNMAMRFATVDEHGKYSKTKHVSDAASKIAYITMMQVRAHICVEAGKNLALACTIVTRYSAVRRQGFKSSDDSESTTTTTTTERQILDYTQQQHRILPLIAASYCFFFTGKLIQSRLVDIESRLVSSSSSSSEKNSSSAVTKPEVADIHASTSGLKSYMTTVAANGIEDCRKACGGHGFLQCSGLPELLTTYLQSPTVEGDNHMLPQQVVKVLLKIVQAVQQQQREKDTGRQGLSDFVRCDSYHLVPSLQSIILTARGGGGGDQNGEKCPASCEEDMQDLDTLCCAFRHVAARLLVECASGMQTAIVKNGKTPDDAWNDALVQMARVSRAYSQFLLLHNFCHGIILEERDAKSCIGVAEVAVFRDLARLLALYWIESEIGDFLQDGYLSAQQADWVRASVLLMLNVVRPNAVALVDARDFSDFRLKSALGRYDGNVYPAIMEAARRDPLNQTERGPGYEEHLKRLIVGGVGVYTGTASRL